MKRVWKGNRRRRPKSADEQKALGRYVGGVRRAIRRASEREAEFARPEPDASTAEGSPVEPGEGS